MYNDTMFIKYLLTEQCSLQKKMGKWEQVIFLFVTYIKSTWV